MLAATACGRLQSIPTEPARTPASWLASQPWTEIALGPWRLFVVQPTTSAIVYLLGLLTIGVGARFLLRHERQRSRLGWGVALLLWGVAALLAGTSYEAFSYAIKCAGRETCAWTSWWEVGYLLLSVWSLDLMTIATARACATGRARRALSVYALANAALYTLTLLVGASVPVRFLDRRSRSWLSGRHEARFSILELDRIFNITVIVS